MVRLVLFSLLLLFPFSVPAQDEGGELVEDFYFNADSTDPDSIRDGSDRYPYKYISEFRMPNSGTVKLYFYAANNSYQYDSINSQSTIFTLPKRTGTGSVKIYKEGSGTVKFNGTFNGADYENGIDIQCSNVTIEDGINFTNFWHNPVYIHGSETNHLSNITIKNCVIDSTRYRDGSTTRNCAAIRSAHAENVLITNCVIRQPNQNAQVDGIFADSTIDLEIRNNSIVLENNEHFFQHLDCMQITNDCSNVTIENNYIENASTAPRDSNRQCIYISKTSGIVRITNNIIVTQVGLPMNLEFASNTDSLHIFNNTLVGKDNPGKLLRILRRKETVLASPGKLNIKNNIFSKVDSNSVAVILDSLWENNLSGYNILDYNLYWNSNPNITPTIAFQDFTRDWNYSGNSYYEENGVGENPLLLSDYSLQYHSPAKNKGIGLFAKVTKDKFGNPRPYWNRDFDIGAYEIEDTQLKIGATELIGNPPPNITHYLKAIDTYWERTSIPDWIISSDQYIDSTAFVTEGNTPSDIDSLYGWEYKWLDRSGDDQNTSIGIGFYEVSNNYNDSARFYIDLRDAVQDYSLNVGIRYNGNLNQYQFYKNGSWNHLIANDTIIRIWDINDGNTHTNNLASYWQNALIPLEKNDHPYLVWGPYDVMEGLSTYRVYCKNGGLSFAAIQPDISSDAMEYLDESKSLILIQSSHGVLYYVSAIGQWESSLSTDTVDYRVAGHDPGKAAGKFSPDYSYSMEQNYPNPFNPLTKILFSIEKEDHVNLKVFDVLGREVTILLNQVMTPGNHEVLFNGESLSSGVYIYRITSGSFSAVKKMQILK